MRKRIRIAAVGAAAWIVTLAGGTPILALDMYEHSYHMEFGAKVAGYVDTFMDVIRWNNAERIFVQMASGQGTGGGNG